MALALILKTGLPFVLNELAKFSKVPQCQVVATSGGDLPVHYIYHAAATRLETDGSSHISTEDIAQSVGNALDLAVAQGVDTIFSPLIGAGTEGIQPNLSLGPSWAPRQSSPLAIRRVPSP